MSRFLKCCCIFAATIIITTMCLFPAPKYIVKADDIPSTGIPSPEAPITDSPSSETPSADTPSSDTSSQPAPPPPEEPPTPTEMPLENKKGYINASNVNIREGYTTDSSILGKVSNDYVTPVSYVVVGEETWYKITYRDITGFVHGDYIIVINIVEPAGDFAAQLETFPAGYRDSLVALHSMYPNWNFVADYVEYDFWDSVHQQTLGHRKLVSMSDGISWRSMGAGNYDWTTGAWTQSSGSWTDASKEVIAYYMDPRNFLTINGVFIFAQQSFDANTQTAEGVQKIIAGTFLENGYIDENDTAFGGSYVNVIMEAARLSGVNPYVLASTIIIEQGVNGTSPLISGEYGFYNFFNYGATGDDVIGNGIAYAQKSGWNTRSAAIIGGARKYGSGYIGVGQDTYYYKNFDILDSEPYTHQYAQSIYDAKASSTKLRAYYSDKPDSSLTFRIPVYKNMPDAAPTQPVETDKLNNYYFTSISAFGLNPQFSMYTQSYTMSVTGDTTINVAVPDTAAYVGEASYALKAGENAVVLTVRSQTGYDNYYTIYITASADCTLTVSTEGRAVLRGDANGDGGIDIIDLAAVRMHILGIRILTDNFFSGGDANGDGNIDIIDLAAVRMHILGLINLQ